MKPSRRSVACLVPAFVVVLALFFSLPAFAAFTAVGGLGAPMREKDGVTFRGSVGALTLSADVPLPAARPPAHQRTAREDADGAALACGRFVDGQPVPAVEPSKADAALRAYSLAEGWVTVRFPDLFGPTKIELTR